MKQNVTLFLTTLLLIIVALFGAALLLALPVMFLWNHVIVGIFQLPEIGYWKAFGIYYFVALLTNRPNLNKND